MLFFQKLNLHPKGKKERKNEREKKERKERKKEKKERKERKKRKKRKKEKKEIKERKEKKDYITCLMYLALKRDKKVSWRIFTFRKSVLSSNLNQNKFS